MLRVIGAKPRRVLRVCILLVLLSGSSELRFRFMDASAVAQVYGDPFALLALRSPGERSSGPLFQTKPDYVSTLHHVTDPVLGGKAGTLSPDLASIPLLGSAAPALAPGVVTPVLGTGQHHSGGSSGVDLAGGAPSSKGAVGSGGFASLSLSGGAPGGGGSWEGAKLEPSASPERAVSPVPGPTPAMVLVPGLLLLGYRRLRARRGYTLTV